MAAPTTQLIAEPGSQNTILVRDFAATPEQVLRAHVEPELLARWLDGGDLMIDHWEARHGGRWQYRGALPGDREFLFRGVFHNDPSVQAGMIQTFEFGAAPGQVGIETHRFEALPGGGTRLTVESAFPSVEARDQAASSGMEHGMERGYVVIEALAAAGEL